MTEQAYHSDEMKQTLLNKERLNVLRELALLDPAQETVYDRLTQLASQAIGVPVSLVSMVGGDFQFFKSMVGLPEPWASDRRTPLSHSFCKHVVATNEPLVIEDAREVDFLKDNMAIPDLDVIGYLGIPLTLSDGKRLGSFCVIDSEKHEWSETEIAIVRNLAEILTQEIDLKARARVDATQQHKVDAIHEQINALVDALDPQNPNTTFLANLQAARARLNI